MTVKTVGLDLAKDVFRVHCVSATGRKIINKKIKRARLIAFFRDVAAVCGWDGGLRFIPSLGARIEEAWS